MKITEFTATLCFLAIVTLVSHPWSSEALAQSSYFTGQGCSGCHIAPVVATCNGCHGHGTHPNSSKNAINLAGTTNMSSYAPGEMVTVTITGGYRTGWVRAVLYDQNMVELARSTGNDSGMGSSANYPVVLSAPAPATTGSYRWQVAWYGHQYDAGGASFGTGWRPDTTNANHGYEVVSIATPFTVATAAPPPPATPPPTLPPPVTILPSLPTISSVSPGSLVLGATNQAVTISGTNLTGATISFSNPGITAVAATVTATTINLLVSVAANASPDTGIVTISTANGSAAGFFEVSATASQPPAISSVTPGSLVQGAVNQTVTIIGANLTDAAVSFSNKGVTPGPVTATATKLSLPVIVAANATAGPGTITVTTPGGAVSSAFTVSPRSSTPMLVLSMLSDGSYTNNATLNISGNVTAATGIQSLIVNNQYVTPMTNGYFSTALVLLPGVNTITVIAIDNAGSQKSDTRVIHYDPTAPVLVVAAPADNSTNGTSFITVSGTVDETSTVAVTNNDGSPQYSSIIGNTFSVSVNLVPGVNTINIAATDLAGNTASAKRTVTYDTSKLTLSVTNPPQDMTTDRASLILMGTVTNSSKEITVTISIDGVTSTYLVTNGIFKQTLTFTAAKQYVITISARDAAGNTSTVTRNVIYTPVVSSTATDGTTTSHPFGWTNPKSSHQSYVEKNGVSSCLSCHSIDAAAQGQAMSCYNCHGKKWTTPTTSSGASSGGSTGGTASGTASHPYGWTNPQQSHPDYVESNGVSSCISCHSTDSASKGQAMSCYNCHSKEW